MHLGIFGALKSAFTRGPKAPKAAAPELPLDDHKYVRGNIADRGPCPGLNALANQGYLPRDGKAITLPRVEAALREALSMSAPLAKALTQTLKPLLRADGTFDLVQLRQHNTMEHDASFTRLDFRQGDNYSFQPHMFDALLADAGGGDEDKPVTLRSLARTYRRRKKESKASGAPGLPIRLWFVNLVQTISLLHTADMGGKIAKDVMRTFYHEERFPDVILLNRRQRTLLGLIFKVLKLLIYIYLRRYR